ncbi:MAG: anti-sigma factor family protein [Thermoflexales bacterium]
MTEDELISAYVDGRLSEAERAALDARMARDVTLRRRVAATRLLVRESRALPALQPPRNFILPLDAGRKPAAPERRRPSSPLWLLRLGSLAATALFVALAASELARPAPFAATPAAAPAAAPAPEMPPQRELATPAEPPAEMAPAAQPMQREALPAAPMQAAAAPEAEGEPAGADAAQRSFQAASEPAATVAAPEPSAAGPITPTRLLAALALLAAIALGLLGWARR